MTYLLTFFIVFTDLSTGEQKGYQGVDSQRNYGCHEFVHMARIYFGEHERYRFETMECSER